MYEEQVAAGVAFLDERIPDWRTAINVDELDMRYSHLCVLGQLGSGYYSMLETLSANGLETELGFDLPYISTAEMPEAEFALHWLALTEQWKAAILAGTST